MNLDALVAFQLLVTIDGYLQAELMECTLFLIGLREKLVQEYPELDHLLSDLKIGDVQKTELAKKIMGIES